MSMKSVLREMYHDTKNPDVWWVILFGVLAVGSAFAALVVIGMLIMKVLFAA